MKYSVCAGMCSFVYTYVQVCVCACMLHMCTNFRGVARHVTIAPDVKDNGSSAWDKKVTLNGSTWYGYPIKAVC